MWDAISGSQLAQPQGHTGAVASVAFSPDGTLIASCSWDTTVRVWDAIPGNVLAELKEYNQSLRSVAFSEDGSQIILEDDAGSSRVWRAGQYLPIKIPNIYPITHRPLNEFPYPTLNFSQASGWLKAHRLHQNNARDLCWIPPKRRGRFWAFHNIAVLFSTSGGITILSVSHL